MKHQYFMEQALVLAKKAEELGEVPVGAILVKNDKIIAKSHNQPIFLNDPTAHAEIQVIRQGAKILNNYRLNNTTLYVTLEPCVMCFGAIIHARIKTVVFAANDKKTGCLGGCQDLRDLCVNHSLEIVGGVMAKQSSDLLRNFFKNKRSNND
ncbi:tRNA-specific adenosine-34 deaminase [hydrothermal vent metagenome]|uniref:tRNA-specific adenosine deaminase 2 n=1 Tax=hydrothermal vent metagenome TaxID=652676 RepID=A0A1W1CTY6_9ZZZZ